MMSQDVFDIRRGDRGDLSVRNFRRPKWVFSARILFLIGYSSGAPILVYFFSVPVSLPPIKLTSHWTFCIFLALLPIENFDRALTRVYVKQN